MHLFSLFCCCRFPPHPNVITCFVFFVTTFFISIFQDDALSFSCCIWHRFEKNQTKIFSRIKTVFSIDDKKYIYKLCPVCVLCILFFVSLAEWYICKRVISSYVCLLFFLFLLNNKLLKEKIKRMGWEQIFCSLLNWKKKMNKSDIRNKRHAMASFQMRAFFWPSLLIYLCVCLFICFLRLRMYFCLLALLRICVCVCAILCANL